MKNKIIILFVLLFFVIPFSCEDFKILVDCDKCYTTLSDKYNIEYKVTLDNENTFVPITLYAGNIDDGIIISRDTVYSLPHYSEMLEFGKYYSAVAKYTHKGRVINAVDGQELRKKLDESSCDESCYTIQGDVLDLRLK